MAAHYYEILLAAGVVSPFVSFWLLVFFGPRLGKPKAGWVAVVLGMGVPLLLSTLVLVGWVGEDATSKAALSAGVFRHTWATLGGIPVILSVKLDSLTVAMYFMVTFIAFWIFVFSIGYMSGHSDEVAGKSKYHRFFAYLSLFAFSMLGLLISSSLLFLFIFWELVGLCSYLLIGYYFDKAFASKAAMKAFITNRVGDFGFLIGLMLVFFHFKTFDLDQAAATFAMQAATHTGIFATSFTLFGWSLATIMGIGLFMGAMGKSAQFPLHVWLPDAMAGPTPVSALIHAATMVAAGVYLVARVFRLMTPEALLFVATIGVLTLTLMALIAMVQVDIKKCLAYSTLSQLGYMIFGMGCGAWVAALFHLITHAFFKAMLFLCSGQVIEGCHHEQDMRKMGGLRKKMPVTCWTFFIGVLAISGAGIPAVHIGLGGYFSKDEILAVAYARTYEWLPENFVEHEGAGGHASSDVDEPTLARLAAFQDHAEPDAHGQPAAHGEPSGGDHASIFANTPPLPKWMFFLALATAYITPFYMMRAWWMTFMGKPRDEQVFEHAHETPFMYVPLVVLAGGTVFASYRLFRPLIADAAEVAGAAPLVLAIDGTQQTLPAIHSAHLFLPWGVGVAFVVSFALAIGIYRNGLGLAGRIKQALLPLHTLLEHKYFIDELYGLVWVKGCVLLAKIARFIDTWVVDMVFNLSAAVTERLAAFAGLIVDKHGVDGIVNGVARSTNDFAGVVRGPQTGRIRNYVLFAAGVATAVIVCLLWFSMESSGSGVSTVSAVR